MQEKRHAFDYAHLALVTPFTKKRDRKCLQNGYDKGSNLPSFSVQLNIE